METSNADDHIPIHFSLHGTVVSSKITKEGVLTLMYSNGHSVDFEGVCGGDAAILITVHPAPQQFLAGVDPGDEDEGAGSAPR